MKKLITLLIIISIIILTKQTFVFAQSEDQDFSNVADDTLQIPIDTPQTPTTPESAVAQSNHQSATQSGTTQKRTTTSNVSCVKVGNVETEKPAVCNQTSSTTTGANTSPAGPRPQAPTPEGDLQIAIQQQFGISMIGYDQQHLQWAWEKFWEVSSTNFNSFVKGAVIQVTDVSSTRQVACPPAVSVLVGQFPEETAFKHILMHELGHVIRNCSGRERAQETAFMNAHKTEGGVSYYAKNAPACTGSDSPSEDYAEMIAFYLNPGTPVASYLKCYPASQNRYTEQEYPLHYQVAKDVLGAY